MTAMEITKSEFEEILSVATSSHVEVYDKVKPRLPLSMSSTPLLLLT